MRRAFAGLLLALLVAPACRSSSTSVAAPTTSKCSITVPANAPALSADGGSGTVSVVAAAECVWTASTDSSWVSITSGPNGQGNGTVAFTAQGNPTATSRRSTLQIGDRSIELVQNAAACSYALSANSATISARGGDLAVGVTVTPGCQWSAASQAPWITTTAGSSGSGNGTVGLSVAANTGAVRTGAVTIAGTSYTITQQAGDTTSACNYDLNPHARTIESAGGTTTLTVVTDKSCSWTAVSQAPWIVITSAASATGEGTVSLAVSANPGGERTGTVMIAGLTFTVTQAAQASNPQPVTCTYTAAPRSQSIVAAGASFNVSLTTQSTCTWTASSNDGWIQVAGVTSGTGSGSVTVTVAANSGSGRTGTATVGGQTITITQAAAPAPPVIPCTYALNPTTQAVTALGGSFTVGVTTQAGCEWQASTNDDWIQFQGMGSDKGSGSGTLSYRVSPGVLFSRTGHITIAGQVLTVNQSALLLTNDR